MQRQIRWPQKNVKKNKTDKSSVKKLGIIYHHDFRCFVNIAGAIHKLLKPHATFIRYVNSNPMTQNRGWATNSEFNGKSHSM